MRFTESLRDFRYDFFLNLATFEMKPSELTTRLGVFVCSFASRYRIDEITTTAMMTNIITRDKPATTPVSFAYENGAAPKTSPV